jgi:hypothetical protein
VPKELPSGGIATVSRWAFSIADRLNPRDAPDRANHHVFLTCEAFHIGI